MFVFCTLSWKNRRYFERCRTAFIPYNWCQWSDQNCLITQLVHPQMKTMLSFNRLDSF